MWSSETVPQDAHKICSCTQNCCWTPHMPQTRTHYKNKQTAHSSLDWWNWEGIKPGTEPEVNAAQCGRGHRICYGNCQAYFAFCTIQPHQAYGNSNRLPEIFVWCRRLFAYKRGVSDVTPVSKLLLIQPWGVALTPLWLTLEQQGTGTAFCTLHTYENKHHQRAPDGMSTSSELGQLLAHLDVLPIYS